MLKGRVKALLGENHGYTKISQEDGIVMLETDGDFYNAIIEMSKNVYRLLACSKTLIYTEKKVQGTLEECIMFITEGENNG